MLTMLVVDDELYALKGITQGIDWTDLPMIGTILEAENVAEARKLLLEHQVDLVISDIEMPGANGLELLKFIREASSATLTVFLTGHARFDYAQEAIQYGCYDYVLKPVDHDVLKDIVKRAIEEIEQRRERLAFEDTLEEYRRQWANQLPILVEKFWQEALVGRSPHSAERLDRELARYDIPLTSAGHVLPVLVSVEQWEMELTAEDESIMEYAVRKAAEEIILGERGALAGAVLQDRSEQSVVLLYAESETAVVHRADLLASCEAYVRACRDYFHCRVSCYVGDLASVSDLPAVLEQLSQLERANVSQPHTVVDANGASLTKPTGGAVVPAFIEWGLLLDRGDMEELTDAVDATLLRLQEEGASRENLELFYFGFVQLLYQAALRSGTSASEFITGSELAEGLSNRSAQLMRPWAAKLLHRAGGLLQDRQRDATAVIAKIQSYIQEHLQEELGRDDIARAVYRNPAYLSRLFRKETGMSLTDYIAQAKIERAKRLLIETNDKVSNIAEGLGYMHFSYFAKLFKKVTGLTPQDYRKRHQAM